MRGEKVALPYSYYYRSGSPPLARGKVGRGKKPRPAGRITPACAGKRSFGTSPPLPWKDHPRLRGEKLLRARSAPFAAGSPPLARGKVDRCGVDDGLAGITPACAGKRQVYMLVFLFKRDHPRLRGEKFLHIHNTSLSRGSPPLARGKASLTANWHTSVWITPACAGKRDDLVDGFAVGGDHPRLRGEKASDVRRVIFDEGSPPLARGKVISHVWMPNPAMDHPRLRGEKVYTSRLVGC